MLAQHREVLGVVQRRSPAMQGGHQGSSKSRKRVAQPARSNGAESVVLVMRFEEQQEQEERLVVVEAADPVDGEIGQSIDSESVEIDTFV